jgi:phosphatidate cytidylyltransferase
MAMNWTVFKTRALTALVFVAVMLTALLWNYGAFFILFSIVHFGCWFEYQRLMEKIEPDYKDITPFHRYGLPVIGFTFMLLMTSDAFMLFDFQLNNLASWIAVPVMVGVLVADVVLSRRFLLQNYLISLGGLVYLSLSFALLVHLRGLFIYSDVNGLHDFGRFLPCIILFSLWINDTMAYIVGSFIGKTPFSKISPKKTWEGTAGGAALCTGVMYLLGPVVFDHAAHPVKYVILWAAIAAIAGTAGDLLESLLKRKAGVKDSGRIMPGHGGFLDRFDSLILATPFVWLGVKLVGYAVT